MFHKFLKLFYSTLKHIKQNITQELKIKIEGNNLERNYLACVGLKANKNVL